MSVSIEQYRANRWKDEEQFRRAIEHHAKQLGYLVYHTTISQFSPAGFPDIVIVGCGRLWFIETKHRDGPVKPLQQQWIDALVAAGADARIIRSHLPDQYDQIIKELDDASEQHFLRTNR